MSIDLRVVSLSRMILEILQEYGSGCKDTEIIAELAIYKKHIVDDCYEEAIQSLADKNKITIIKYDHRPINNRETREQRFIFRNYAN